MSINQTTRHLRDVTSVPAPTRREERRADEMARAEQRRADAQLRAEQRREDAQMRADLRRADEDAALERDRIRRADALREKRAARKERSARWTARRTKTVAAISEHMPLAGLPVVAVSLVVGWTGQAGAAVHLGMGPMAFGMPVLTEGMVLTLAGLTAHAISAKPKPLPYAFLYRATWAAGLFAALANAGGHLIEDASAAGVYRAVAYAIASLAGLVLWSIVMRSKRAAADGASAAQVARWRRIRWAYPRIARRAQRIADLADMPYADAFALAWERRTAAGTAEPTIREIRRHRKTARARAEAEAWDGNGRRPKSLATATDSAPEPDPDPVPETAPEPAVETPATVPGLWLPDGSGEFRNTRFPGRDAVPGTVSDAAEMPFPAEKSAPEGADDGNPLGLSERVLKNAAREWMKRYRLIEQDRRFRSPTGHLGVSPYAVASALKLRKETGPAIVATLLDRQMIPATD